MAATVKREHTKVRRARLDLLCQSGKAETRCTSAVVRNHVCAERVRLGRSGAGCWWGQVDAERRVAAWRRDCQRLFKELGGREGRNVCTD